MTERPWHEHERDDIEGVGPRWRDVKFPASADRIDSASTRYRFDYDELIIEFDNNSRIANEKLGFISQMNHDWLEGTPVKPHIHWLQDTNGEPHWHIKWRAYNNGDDVPAVWNEAAHTGNVFTYSTGTIMQITTFPEIDMTGLSLSCVVDMIIGRDTGNISGKFSGVDPVGSGVKFKEFDIHALFDSRGSRQEFIK